MTELGPLHSTGVQYEAPPDVDLVPPFDPRSGNHFWIIPVCFAVNPDSWRPGEQTHLDMENLVMVSGAGCYYCEQPYSRRLATRRCKGQPGRI